MERLAPLLINIITAAAGSLLTLAATVWWSFESSKIQYFDVFTKNEIGFFDASTLPDNESYIYTGKEKNKALSKVTIDVYNYSSFDYSDVPVSIFLNEESGNELILVGKSITGFDGFSEGVKNIQIKKPKSSEKYRSKHLIKIANRVKKFNPTLKAELYFKGRVDPKIKVKFHKKGVIDREFKYENSPYISKRKRTEFMKGAIIFIGSGIFVIFIFMPILSLITKPSDIANRKKNTKHIFKEIKKSDLLNEIPSPKIKNLIIDATYRQRESDWNNSSFISKWIFGFQKPKRQDFEFDD